MLAPKTVGSPNREYKEDFLRRRSRLVDRNESIDRNHPSHGLLDGKTILNGSRSNVLERASETKERQKVSQERGLRQIQTQGAQTKHRKRVCTRVSRLCVPESQQSHAQDKYRSIFSFFFSFSVSHYIQGTLPHSSLTRMVFIAVRSRCSVCKILKKEILWYIQLPSCRYVTRLNSN